ncbi:DUF397 domain-containing protein [Nocardiopsis sp. LSu2-4]|uniref:DUF397 domain-containing protein n=1 Tax=Nocardiopsis suaedae TaxID=3018444 RepID=A0ABT4TEU0_9ACTN|nr:DUF397 domain-containing protein [Nocardiopsis suaedae]MDA2803227.1 DUF397 domain-containing protein [Nocardiopsis suaedae]
MEWRKSSYSSPEGQECVEVGRPRRPSTRESRSVYVRDSRSPDFTPLALPVQTWVSFIAAFR